jgi:hypothetical protein
MDSKFILTSKTIIGLLVAALALFCQYKGVTFTDDDQGNVSDIIFKAVEAVGLAVALVGRIVASQPLHVVPKSDESDGTPPSTPSAGMLFLVGILSLGVLGAGFLPGCSTFVTATPATPQDQAIKEVRQATVLYIAAVTTFNDLVALNKIDKQTAADLEIVRQRAWARLTAAKQAAEAGTPVDSTTSLQLFMDDLNAINALILKVPYTPTPLPAPATAPTPRPET